MSHTRPFITIFNDDDVFLDLMGELLAEEGYTAHSGLVDGNAYQYVKQTQPDLVILDFLIGKPQSAWNILELIRLDPTTAHLPVLISSANTPLLRENGERLKQLQCAILQKPFDLADLLQQVAALIPS